MKKQKEESSILGIKVSQAGVKELHRAIGLAIGEGVPTLVLNVNVHCIVLALRERWLMDFLNQAPLVYCDGDGVRWGMRILGSHPPPKVGFTRWIWDLAGYCADQGFSLYLLGGSPGVAQQAGEALRRKYPNLRLAGHHHGYFAKSGAESDEVIGLINEVKPDVLIIGFGMPIQERWLMENWKRIKAKIFLPGGAVLDYAAGRLGQAPRWMIRCHLEWLFRIWEDPKRLAKRYAYDLPFFFWRVLAERLKMIAKKES